jgi:hypothetical protein
MGWTAGKDPETLGEYAYVLWNGFETLHTVGGFKTMREADQAGGRANARWLLYGITDPDDVLAEMSDYALLIELMKEI